MSPIHTGVVRVLLLTMAAILSASLAAQNYVSPNLQTTPGIGTTGRLVVVSITSGVTHTDPHADGNLVCYSSFSRNTFTVHYFNLPDGLWQVTRWQSLRIRHFLGEDRG